MEQTRISVEISYFALLREERGLAAEKLAVMPMTAAGLYGELAGRHGFSLPAERVRVAVNDRFCPDDQLLRDGDRVVFVPPVAGG